MQPSANYLKLKHLFSWQITYPHLFSSPFDVFWHRFIFLALDLCSQQFNFSTTCWDLLVCIDLKTPPSSARPSRYEAALYTNALSDAKSSAIALSNFTINLMGDALSLVSYVFIGLLPSVEFMKTISELFAPGDNNNDYNNVWHMNFICVAIYLCPDDLMIHIVRFFFFGGQTFWSQAQDEKLEIIIFNHLFPLTIWSYFIFLGCSVWPHPHPTPAHQ